MSQIESIGIHPTALLNISDSASRNAGSKFGILLGKHNSTNVVIHTAYEILFEDKHLIDIEYNLKRYDQFKVVLPEYSFVGIYQINNDSLFLDEFSSNAFAQVSQLMKDVIPTTVLIFNRQASEHQSAIQAYVEGIPTKTYIINSESEFVATSTIANHKVYHTVQKNVDEDEDLINDTGVNPLHGSIKLSVDQLQERIQRILDFLESAQQNSSRLSQEEKITLIQINNKVVYLSNKLTTFREASAVKGGDSHNVQSSQLSLITEQLIALDNLKLQIGKNIVRFGMQSFHPGL
ncbi:uncharacterized protein RJT21DRAFT_116877 [Scheffersomyces amazonensis]|uniref:uncharacterized protein n=1 Tax=Scheffersomyces amazonensis TaxID=1078765 RepID=UPI00315D3C97